MLCEFFELVDALCELTPRANCFEVEELLSQQEFLRCDFAKLLSATSIEAMSFEKLKSIKKYMPILELLEDKIVGTPSVKSTIRRCTETWGESWEKIKKVRPLLNGIKQHASNAVRQLEEETLFNSGNMETESSSTISRRAEFISCWVQAFGKEELRFLQWFLQDFKQGNAEKSVLFKLFLDPQSNLFSHFLKNCTSK